MHFIKHTKSKNPVIFIKSLYHITTPCRNRALPCSGRSTPFHPLSLPLVKGENIAPLLYKEGVGGGGG